MAKLKSSHLIALGILTCLFHCKEVSATFDFYPKAKSGLLILTNQSLEQKSILPLEGEWELCEGFGPSKNCSFTSVPGYWKETQIQNLSGNRYGAATYKLRIRGLEPGEYALKMHEIHNAYRLFVNQKLLLSFGTPALQSEQEVRKIGKPVVSFLVEKGKRETQIALEVSNWFEGAGGIRRTPELGSLSDILALDRAKRNLDFLTFGALIFFGFSSFFFYVITKEEFSSLFLSLFCGALAIRIFFTEEHYVLEWFPNFPPVLESRIDVGSLFVCGILFMSYLRCLFPYELNLTTFRVFLIPNILWLSGFWMFHGEALEKIFQVYLGFLILTLAAITIVAIQAYRRNRTGAKVFLASWALFFFGAANDILSRFGIISTPYISPYTFLLFIAFQSILISVRYKSLLQFADSLNKELDVKFRAISSSVQEAILVSDSSERILYWNEGANEIFGWTSSEIVGKPLETIIPEGFRNGYHKLLSSGDLTSLRKPIELPGVRKDGTEFPFELSLTAWTVEGRSYIGAIIRDITQRKVLEEQRDRALDTLRKDLHTAEKMQKSMLPLPDPKRWPFPWDILYYPMGPIGGDLYDIRQTANGNWRFFIADATGHGAQAAMLTMAIKADYDSFEEPDMDPGKVLTHLNHKVYPLFRNLNSFFTAFILDWDPRTGTLHYASGGHPEQILQIGMESVLLPKTGPMIGLYPAGRFHTRTFTLEKKNPIRFYLFSDGAFEVSDDRETELFGEERMLASLLSKSSLPIRKTLDLYFQELIQFQGRKKFEDDLTLLVADISSL
ncbi:hypothetical protein CH373_05365 [Leptospira perolatii]|uniref:PAS domain-containing protein n=1 Tax=Leptospira perolatii TaxID=2023191 RepID=A0A2M9ZQI7_9LEPT|nr:SpoIIE family protein phosphatase [Leptospira perolatii]PJZ70500.1 hypothetical protein CH360_05785 [Leptospira perolatii]PJZ74336.1 hypothetical protein CH373_05365 [Leptospira perolatii]